MTGTSAEQTSFSLTALSQIGATLLAAAGVSVSSSAHAKPLSLAHALYCIEHPSECPLAGATVVKWTPRVHDQIVGVHRQINLTMTPALDPPGRDIWTAGAATGDCEDFALTKRRALIRLGYPPRALRLRVVTRRKPNDHVVLEVVTSNRVYVLDVPGAHR